MRKRYLFLIIGLLMFMSSCDKLFPDEKLTLQRKNYTGNELRTDGYYYTQFGDIYKIYFFYSNGILFSGGDVYKNNISEYEQRYKDGSFGLSKKNNKLYWGLFQIKDNKVKVEKWYPSSGGGMPAYLHSGEILNDTTFVITKSVHPKTGKEKELNEVYHFKQFDNKPDSTNNFIK